MRRTICFLIFTCSFLTAFGQAASDTASCKSLLKKVYWKMGRIGQAEKAFTMQFTVESQFHGEGYTEPLVQPARLSVQGKMFLLESPELLLAKDEKLEVAVFKNHKKILVSSEMGQPRPINVAVVLEEILIEGSVVLNCSGGKDAAIHTIVLRPSTAYAEQQQVDSISFRVDQVQEMLKGFQINFKEGSFTRYQRVDIQSIDELTISHTNLSKPQELVFDQKGRLLPKYQSFQLIDSRLK